MRKIEPNVQKLDVQPLDIVRAAVTRGLRRLQIRKRLFKLDFWRGTIVAEETVTTVEPTDDRN
jgi:hypothetical protein